MDSLTMYIDINVPYFAPHIFGLLLTTRQILTLSILMDLKSGSNAKK